MSMDSLLYQLLPEMEHPLPKVTTIHLSSGDSITVEKDVAHGGIISPWKVDGQIFDHDVHAENFLRQRIQEKLTHIRVIHHPRYAVPHICGTVCPHPEHDRSICNDCPVADEAEARRDRVQLVYAVLSKQVLADVQNRALAYILATIEDQGFRITVYEENGKECGLEIEGWTTNGVDMCHLIDLRNQENPYDPNVLLERIRVMVESFDPDEEVRVHMAGSDFRMAFSYYEAAIEFENWQKNLHNLEHYVCKVEKKVPELCKGMAFESNLSYKKLLEN